MSRNFMNEDLKDKILNILNLDIETLTIDSFYNHIVDKKFLSFFLLKKNSIENDLIKIIFINCIKKFMSNKFNQEERNKLKILSYLYTLIDIYSLIKNLPQINDVYSKNKKIASEIDLFEKDNNITETGETINSTFYRKYYNLFKSGSLLFFDNTRETFKFYKLLEKDYWLKKKLDDDKKNTIKVQRQIFQHIKNKKYNLCFVSESNDYEKIQLEHNIEIIKILGQGAQGFVSKTKNNTALKVNHINNKDKTKNENEKLNKLKEAYLLQQLNSKYIVEFKKCILSQDKNLLLLEIELCEFELHNFILHTKNDINISKRKFNKEIITFLSDKCYQLLSGLEFLQEKQIIHRDLKPANILLDSNLNIKITDFGISKQLNLDENYATTCIGTGYYNSPEKFKGKYDYKADIWSLGIIIFELILTDKPFNIFESLFVKNLGQLYFKIFELQDLPEDKIKLYLLNYNNPIEILCDSEEECKDLNEKIYKLLMLQKDCLKFNKNERPTASKLINKYFPYYQTSNIYISYYRRLFTQPKTQSIDSRVPIVDKKQKRSSMINHSPSRAKHKSSILSFEHLSRTKSSSMLKAKTRSLSRSKSASRSKSRAEGKKILTKKRIPIKNRR